MNLCEEYTLEQTYIPWLPLKIRNPRNWSWRLLTIVTHTHTHLTHGTGGVLDCLLYCAFSKESPCGVLLFLLKFLVGYYCSIVASTPHSMACTRTVLCKVYIEDLLLFPSIVPFVVGLKLFRHLPLDLYTFFNRGHLLTITANRGPIVPLCYKSSVYPLHIPTHTHTWHMALVGYLIVFSIVPFLKNPLVGYYCSKYPTLYARVHAHIVLCKVYTEDLLLFPSIVPFVVGRFSTEDICWQ